MPQQPQLPGMSSVPVRHGPTRADLFDPGHGALRTPQGADQLAFSERRMGSQTVLSDGTSQQQAASKTKPVRTSDVERAMEDSGGLARANIRKAWTGEDSPNGYVQMEPQYRTVSRAPRMGDGVEQPAALLVDESNDSDWSQDLWAYGGGRRMTRDEAHQTQTKGALEGEKASYHDKYGRDPAVTQVWDHIGKRQTIRADQDLRSGQENLRQRGESLEALRRAPSFEDGANSGLGDYQDSSTRTHDEALPWVARINGKSYLLDGNHRASVSRRRGGGDFEAQVIEASSPQGFRNMFENHMTKQTRQYEEQADATFEATVEGREYSAWPRKS